MQSPTCLNPYQNALLMSLGSRILPYQEPAVMWAILEANSTSPPKPSKLGFTAFLEEKTCSHCPTAACATLRYAKAHACKRFLIRSFSQTRGRRVCGKLGM